MLTEQAAMQYFIPLAQNSDSVLRSPVTALLVRTAGPAEDMVATVRREMQATVDGLPYPEINPFPAIVARLLTPWRRGAVLLGLFGALGLLLAALGLYGVQSYLVSQRTRELGIRIALGAGRPELLRLVVRQGLRVALLGVLLGAGAALVAGNVVASLLYGVSPRDPLILTGVALVLLAIAALASFLPAHRATKVDPMVALRYE
jgi:putative ABC transport system permease protein